MTRADLQAVFAEVGSEPDVIRYGFFVTSGMPTIKDTERALLAVIPPNGHGFMGGKRRPDLVAAYLRTLAREAMRLADYLTENAQKEPLA